MGGSIIFCCCFFFCLQDQANGIISINILFFCAPTAGFMHNLIISFYFSMTETTFKINEMKELFKTPFSLDLFCFLLAEYKKEGERENILTEGCKNQMTVT